MPKCCAGASKSAKAGPDLPRARLPRGSPRAALPFCGSHDAPLIPPFLFLTSAAGPMARRRTLMLCAPKFQTARSSIPLQSNQGFFRPNACAAFSAARESSAKQIRTQMRLSRNKPACKEPPPMSVFGHGRRLLSVFVYAIFCHADTGRLFGLPVRHGWLIRPYPRTRGIPTSPRRRVPLRRPRPRRVPRA